MGWDPATYLKFGGERTRPAADLLAHVEAEDPGVVYDLGCGPGNSTALLAARWPTAHITGLDSDSNMLERANRSGPSCRWLQGDVAEWQPDEDPDVIFSNAVLHWLDDHQSLLPKLMGFLKPGGALAVQMPRNHSAPSHTLLQKAALAGPWAERLAALLRPEPVARPEQYFRWLVEHANKLEIWETTYLLRLTGADPVLAWARGTALKPLLDALDERSAAAFEAAYAARLRDAYPCEPDGTTLFPFRRLFIVAVR
jgi:trans-aconitate 2-methyltransferase